RQKIKLKTRTQKNQHKTPLPKTLFEMRSRPSFFFFPSPLATSHSSLFISVPQLPSPSPVRLALSQAPVPVLQTPRDACQCPLPCAARKSSIAHPTSKVAPTRHDSPCRTSSAATNPYQS